MGICFCTARPPAPAQMGPTEDENMKWFRVGPAVRQARCPSASTAKEWKPPHLPHGVLRLLEGSSGDRMPSSARTK